MRSIRSTRSVCALLALFITTSLVAPGLAHADDAMVTITLKNGTRVHGELVEEVPGDHTTIKLATGEVRVIKAEEIAPRESGGATDSGRPVESATSTHADDSTGAGRGAPDKQVRVHLAVGDSTLQRLDGEVYVRGAAKAFGERWTTVCRAPCDASVDTTSEFRLIGDGSFPTDRFRLEPGAATVSGQLGSVSRRAVGIPVFIVGVAGAALASVAIVSLSTQSDDPADVNYGKSDHLSLWIVGDIAAIGLAVLGGYLWASSAEHVDVNGRYIGSAGSIRLGSGFALSPRGLEF